MLAYITLAKMQTFSASYLKILLTDKARRVKYISRILKRLERFYFYILHFVYVRRIIGKDVMSYFASSSSKPV